MRNLIRTGATALVAVALLVLALSASSDARSSTTHREAASAATSSNVPYSLPVQIPADKSSPSVSSQAPYTPAVLNLIAQLEPSNPPTEAEIANASTLLHGGTNTTCNNVGPTAAPTGTHPSIMPMCWTDAQGVNTFAGPNAEMTTGPTTLMNLASSFDTNLANVWGQTEGTEARELMVTGLFGPQTDIDRLPNWGRNLTTTGEDPYLSEQMVAAQINGIQSAGAMSEMKHFAVYNGQSDSTNTQISDQALHEIYLAPYEAGFVDGRAAATMCSYQIWQDTSSHLPQTAPVLNPSAAVSPFASSSEAASLRTWPLDESHYSCEQPLTLSYALRDLWGSEAMVGSDYPATESTSAIFQGEDQEQPTTDGYFSDSNALSTSSSGGFGGPPSGYDATGDTCASASGAAESCTTAGAIRVAGIPGPGCPTTGCTLAEAVTNGTVPLSVFNQALATELYQEQRFGLLGCNQSPAASTCTNPGGIGGDQTGTAPLPTGPSSGASPTTDLGSKDGDAAVSERMSEEGAVLLKNDSSTLPITSADLKGGVLVTGPGAEYTIADPTGEASVGYADRDAINPLQQLRSFSGDPSAFTYVPANSPSGETVPSTVLSSSDSSVTGGLSRTTGPGSPTTDSTLNFTTVSGHQLGSGDYTWTGYVYVPTTDTYTFRFQFSPSVSTSDVTFSLDGTNETLTTPTDVYGTGVTGAHSAAIQGTPTNAGETQAGLTNEQYSAGTLTGGSYHQVTITFDNTTSSPASFRFAYSRANGDIADAAAAAKGKKLAIVFLNDNDATTTIPNPYGSSPATISAPEQLTAQNTQLVDAVSAANPNTVVVLNTTNPILTPWLGQVKSALEMWFSGEEGGTSTARLLLGLADPSGHTDITWPAKATDTIWGYDETKKLYAGDTLGPHLERLNGGPNGTTDETEGIYNGYRFFDKEGITPQFAFGFGLSYTTFAFSGLHVARDAQGGLDVSLTVKNTGSVAGAAVPQLYLGAPSNAPKGIQFAVRQLVGFDRVSLAPGQSQTVQMTVGLRELQYWDTNDQRWRVAGGERTIYAGDADSMSELPLQTTVTIPKQANVTCDDQQLSAAVVSGNVTIPSGDWCDMVSDSVAGNVTFTGDGLRMTETTVDGNLTANHASADDDPLSSGTNVVCDSTIKGNLAIRNSSSSAPWSIGLCGPDTIGGNLVFSANTARINLLHRNRIKHDLVCSGAQQLTGSAEGLKGTTVGRCGL
jgi:beta-glucosidase